MSILRIAEVPSPMWSLRGTLPLGADRSGKTVLDYLKERGIVWEFNNAESADVRIYKPSTLGQGKLRYLRARLEFLRQKRPAIFLLGEPREIAPHHYALASPRSTLAAAPGRDFRRLYFASEWTDPQLENWPERRDRVCWIGRPLPSRVAIASELERAGVPLDIFSKQPWPLASWKGFAEDEPSTAALYKFRIVAENYATHGYHSEKLFNAIRAGNVAFYLGDPALEIPHLTNAYLPLDVSLVRARHVHATSVLKGIERVMFTDAWEPHSFRAFYDRIIALAREQIL